MLRLPAWALCCCLVVADGLLGCGNCDKEGGDPRDFAGGRTNASCTLYQTGGFDEPYVDFPAGRRWRIAHGLGRAPDSYKSYLAFVSSPLPQGENGNTAESAGNQVIVEGVDDQFIRVRNDTCEDFYLRLVVEAFEPDPACLAGQGAAGAGGGA